MLLNDELGRTLKEAFMGCFKTLSNHLMEVLTKAMK